MLFGREPDARDDDEAELSTPLEMGGWMMSLFPSSINVRAESQKPYAQSGSSPKDTITTHQKKAHKAD